MCAKYELVFRLFELASSSKEPRGAVALAAVAAHFERQNSSAGGEAGRGRFQECMSVAFALQATLSSLKAPLRLCCAAKAKGGADGLQTLNKQNSAIPPPPPPHTYTPPLHHH